jgi:hypothetical protein
MQRIAWLLLTIWTLELLWPFKVFALTSGPAQPEAQSFQQAGVSDMVDLFTGDMKYNIPLFDIDGYPVNLNYNSGVGMDDEASWVGLGWNLNVGAINRQLRGIPDDFAGDVTTVTHYTKPKITVGGRATIKGEIGGHAALKGSFTLGVFSDNYTGIGAEIGANAGISLSLVNDNYLTASLGLGVLSNTASGVDVTPQISLSISKKATDNLTVSYGLSATLGYNTRSGLKDLTLGNSFSMKGKKITDYIVVDDAANVITEFSTISEGAGNFSTSKSFVTYNTEPVSPKVNIPYHSSYESYSFDVGGAKAIFFAGAGGTGYRSVMTVLNEKNTNRAYGYLYAEKAKHQKNVILDFIREQDNPVVPEMPNLAMPIHTPDLFSYSGQVAGGQFRLYRGGTGAYFDNEATNVGQVSTAGFDLGFGAYFHGGPTLFEQENKATSRKWRNDNQYLNSGDFQDISFDNPKKEHVAFRQVGERIASDTDLDDKLHHNKALAVNIQRKTALSSFKSGNQVISLNQKIEKEKKPKNTIITYLTASEAKKAGRDQSINNYPFNNLSFTPPANHQINPETIQRIARDTDYRKGHHVSEITVTDMQGARSVYGLPVYNITQQEYTFAIGKYGKDYTKFNRNQTQLYVSGDRPSHQNGIDHYYLKEEKPAYASSYLLTQVLSADYIDRGEPGISEDDAGSAVKFNYSKVHANYGWRTPFPSKNVSRNATINRGLLADPDDDKASFVYGEKELWYLSSIETKTKIAYFITEDRLDAIGASSWWGGLGSSGARQKRLVEIRLYSKNNTTKPIKTVKLCQSYSLCPGTPNSIATGTEQSCSVGKEGGKLILNRLWFEYGNTNKGKYHPYIFSYHNAGYTSSSNGTPSDIPYSTMSTDRWGVYKGDNQSTANALTNDEFPYTPQGDPGKMHKNSALWSLSTIELPTGAKITIDYESDDYAYVQNKKAMQMVPFETFDNGSDSDLNGAKGIKLTIDATGAPTENLKQTQWFKNTYLNGSNFLYTKFFVRMANNQNPAAIGEDDKDFIATYCKVDSVKIDGNVATILFESVSGGGITDNPIRFAAWQNVKLNYPRYAYPGFHNRIDERGLSRKAAGVISAIVNASKNLSELKENFYKKSKRKGWCREIVKAKSFVRLVKRDGKKLGGGLRVKKIRIEDEWRQMAGNSANTSVYGQSYEYTTERDGKTISSGVASYEPGIGNDENPLKLPINYEQKIKGALSNFFSLEQPFGESLFPAPSVGYSKITVRDLDASGSIDAAQRTGYLVHEFYTAKEFPVKVIATNLQKNENRSKSFFSLTKSDSRHENVLSQGYYIELNDMHGKGKSVLTYNQSDALIRSTRYYYNTEEIAPGEMRLKNQVSVIKGGIVKGAIIGRDMEFYTDFREHESNNVGRTYNMGIDIFPVPFWPFFPLPHTVPVRSNNDYKLFRSACAVKVVQYYGVMDKVEQMENGSTVTTENMAYDADTGQPVVTRTLNEFKKNVYTVNFPAHWVYSGMAGAYQNVGTLIKGLQKEGNSLNSPFKEILHGGDELLNINNGKVFWVVEDEEGNKNLVDRQGYVQTAIEAKDTFKITRSGHRNLLSASASTLTCLENPIVNGHLLLEEAQESMKVLNASAQTFSEKWYPEPTKIKMDTNSVAVPPYHVWAKIEIENQHIVNDGCKKLTVGKLKMKFYKSNSTYTASFTPENSVTYGSSVRVYFITTNPDIISQYSLDIGGNNMSQVLITTDNMYDSEFAILSEEGTCYNNHYLIQHNFSFLQHNYNPGIRQKYISDVKGGSYPVITQQPVNPYLLGYKGNWRPYKSKVIQLQRENLGVLNSKGANIAKSGYIKDFKSYWYLKSELIPYPQPNSSIDVQLYKVKWVENAEGGPWLNANTVTAYNQYGQELENKDATDFAYEMRALGIPDDNNVENHDAFARYSSADFDFNGQFPSAVASNAMRREIYSNSFEDLIYRSTHYDNKRNDVDFKHTTTPLADLVNSTTAHTGNYSLDLPEQGISLKTFAHFETHGFRSYLKLNDKKEYLINDDRFYWGFEPMPHKKYLFTAWVKDTQTNVNKDVSVNLTLNGSPVSLKCVAVVEKWKKIEGVIDLTAFASMQTFDLKLSPGSNASGIKVDDIRIHPYNSHMKTYAYDDKNYRVMAELDENAFATFYEYDDEGALVRVKKETERGIVTIKESRSSYRKKPL